MKYNAIVDNFVKILISNGHNIFSLKSGRNFFKDFWRVAYGKPSVKILNLKYEQDKFYKFLSTK